MDRYASYVSPFLLKYNSISKNAIPASLNSPFKQKPPVEKRASSSSSKNDYYEVLGLSQSCTEKEIRKAYKKLAKQYHPDKNLEDPQSAELFKNIHDAYETLCNSDKRRKYDLEREMFKLRNCILAPKSCATAAKAASSSSLLANFATPSAFQQASNFQHQLDIFHTISVSLEEVYSGKRKKFQVSRYTLCKECNDQGFVHNAKSIACTACNGKGYKHSSAASDDATSSSYMSSPSSLLLNNQVKHSPCVDCKGTGVEHSVKCESCNGTKRLLTKSSVRVDVPAGIAHGQQIILKGQGDESYASTRGDLVFTIEEKAHDKFLRSGANLFVKHQVTQAEIMSGVCNLGNFLDGKQLLWFSNPLVNNTTSCNFENNSAQQLAANNCGKQQDSSPSASSAPSQAASSSSSSAASSLFVLSPHNLFNSVKMKNKQLQVLKCAKRFGLPMQKTPNSPVNQPEFGNLYIKFEYNGGNNSAAHLLPKAADLIPQHFLNQKASTIPLADVLGQEASSLPSSWFD